MLKRAKPTGEEIVALECSNDAYDKYAIIQQCPRCNSKLEFLDYGKYENIRIVQCSEKTCIRIRIKRPIPLMRLPRFMSTDYVLYSGKDMLYYKLFDEAVKIIIGKKPGFSELLSLKPHAPQCVVDEFNRLKNFYAGITKTCKDDYGNKYGV